eukprot:PhF_6_TR34741/c0_g1_i2/m.50561/K14285/NXT1_2, P15; NTF2-related export protein 1/2
MSAPSEYAIAVNAATNFVRRLYSIYDDQSLRCKLTDLYYTKTAEYPVIDWNGHSTSGNKDLATSVKLIFETFPTTTRHAILSMTAQPMSALDPSAPPHISLLVVVDGTAVYGEQGHVFGFVHRLVLIGPPQSMAAEDLTIA